MANEILTAGVTVSYAFEAEAGTRPETGYLRLPCIKGTPDINPEPQSLDVTDFSDTEWKRYIPNIKDPGGALGLMANNTDEFQAAWFALCYFSEEARTDEEGSRATWFEVKVPGLDDAFYFSGSPSALGVLGMEVGVVAEVTANITPNGVASWETASTEPAIYIVPIQTQYLTTANSPLSVVVSFGLEEHSVASAVSSNEDAATVEIDGNTIIITKVGAGETYITVLTEGDEGLSGGTSVFKTVVS